MPTNADVPRALEQIAFGALLLFGMVAAGVLIGAASVAGGRAVLLPRWLVVAGYVVAVIVPPAAQGAQNQGPISKIVFQQIKVLASGPKIDSPENQREPTNAKAVTLQVTPEQAEKL